MDTYISEWVDAQGRRHILYLPVALDEIPLGDPAGHTLEIIVDDCDVPRAVKRTADARRSPWQRLLDWFAAPLAYDKCPALDVED